VETSPNQPFFLALMANPLVRCPQNYSNPNIKKIKRREAGKIRSFFLSKRVNKSLLLHDSERIIPNSAFYYYAG